MEIERKYPIFGSLHIREAWILIKRIFLMMALLTMTRLLFFLFNMEHFSDLTFSRLVRIFTGGLQFDISAFMYLNAPYIVLYILPFPFRYHEVYQKILKYLFFLVNGIVLAANVFDFFYFDFILKRSTADVFLWAKEGNIFRLLQQFLRDYFIGFAIWVMLVVPLVYFYGKIKLRRPDQIRQWIYYSTGILFLLLTTYLSVIGMRGSFVHSFRPISLGNAAKYTEKPREMSIVLNTPFTILKTLNKQPLQQKNYFSKEELEKIYSPVIYPVKTQPFRNHNVVIIILESWSKEFIGAFNRDLEGGNYKGYTPFLDSLIGRSKAFSRSFANGRRSIEALPSVVASIPSMVQPYVTSKYASNRITGLATLLNTLGYQTAFFHGAPNGSMGFEAFMKLAGYDEYYGMDEYGNSDDYDGIWGVWDEEFFQFFARELNRFEEPFHATIFSVSSHHPFKVPERYEQTFKGGPLVSHKPTEYTDMALRKFFQTASRMPWFNNTLFVITADHTAPYSIFDVYKTQVGKYSVPIIFYCPSEDENFIGMDTTVIQQIDIMPTVLGYLNYPDPYFTFGKNALDTTDSHFAIAFTENAYQLITGEYLLQFRDDEAVGMYNYESDKLLTNNIAGQDSETQVDMEKFIKAFIQQYNNRMIQDRLIIDSINQYTNLMEQKSSIPRK